MENNFQHKKAVNSEIRAGASNIYVNMLALFVAGSATTYLALKSDGYSFFTYIGIFGGIYLPIIGLHWLYVSFVAKK